MAFVSKSHIITFGRYNPNTIEKAIALPLVATVPLVGRVMEVLPVRVNVVEKLPEKVSVLAALLATPVPPAAGGNVPAVSAEDDVE